MPEKISLDDESLDLEKLSMPALNREISLQKRPNVILCKMMNILESKRQRKGYGWSRAWNKYGLNVFRTHRMNFDSDADVFENVAIVLEKFLDDLPDDYRKFIEDLNSDNSKMAFTFYHNMVDDGQEYEGLTVSMGRKVVDDKTKRDRLDFIMEDLRADGRVDGQIDRLRIYVCPWSTYTNKDYFVLEDRELKSERRTAVQGLYELCIDKYNQWKFVDDRQWSHWSQKFIDYFGPRTFIPQGSSFT